MSGKYIDLDGSSEYAYKSSPSNLDLNGAERITAQTNRDFETSVGDWAGNGNHSIIQSNEDKKAGTYSGKITASGAGDGTTNYISLAQDKFTELIDGEKYTVEMWVRGAGILGSELVSNSTDWTDDSGDGLANSWQNIYPSGVTTSIVTGNGFTGNAQRIEAVGGVTILLATSSFIVTSGKTYELTFKYRGTNNGGAYSLMVGYGNFAFIAALNNNTGNCISKTFRFTATSTSYLSFYDYITAAGAYIEIDEVSLKEITQPSVTIKIGNQTKTIPNISCVPGTFTKLVWNFQATANEVGQPLKIYVNQADSVYIDSVQFKKSYDLITSFWFKSSTTGTKKSITSRYAPSIGVHLYISTANKIQYIVTDGTTAKTITGATTVTDGTWHFVSVKMDRIGNLYLYLDGVSDATAVDITSVGVITTSAALNIGFNSADYFNGFIGEGQWNLFDDVADSDYVPLDDYNNGIRDSYTGGGTLVVAHYKFDGDNMTEVLRDRSASGNNLTGVNLDMTDVGTTADYPSHYKESLAGSVSAAGKVTAELKNKAKLEGAIQTSGLVSGYLRSFANLEGEISAVGKVTAELKSKANLEGEINTSATASLAVRRKSEFDLLHIKITEEV